MEQNDNEIAVKPVVKETPAQKPKIAKWLMIMLLILATLVIGVALGVGAVFLINAHQAQVSQLHTATGQTLPAPQINATVGQTITVNGIQATLVGRRVVKAGQFDVQPRTGYEYVEVQVKLVNKSGGMTYYSQDTFALLDSNKNITTSLFVSTIDHANDMTYGTIAPNSTVTGNMVFESPVGDHQTALLWRPLIAGSQSIYGWTLGL